MTTHPTQPADLPANNDIFDALYGVRLSFRRAGLGVPAAIVLATHEDGMRFLSAINASGMPLYRAGGSDAHAKPVEHPDGSVWMEAEFAGIKIHWPANRIAVKAGGYVYG